MATKKMEKAKEEFAYSFILEALTQGLYPNVFDVLREYVQNSYDAIVKHNSKYHSGDYKIKINITGNSIFISDNGIGMDEEKIKQYRYIGYSEKRMGEEAGFRGIGKLSGISVADKLIVTSKYQSAEKDYTLVFDTQSMLREIMYQKRMGISKSLNDLIRNNTSIDSKPARRESHYTVVELYNIREEYSSLLDSLLVSEYISRICPVPFHPAFLYRQETHNYLIRNVQDYFCFPHLVNDSSVYKQFTNNVDSPIFYEIDTEEGSNTPIAFAWACQNLEEKQLPEIGPRGLSFRQKNISIGDKDLVRNSLWATSGHLAYWFFGEIHVVDNSVVPTSERTNFEDSASRARLIKRCQKHMISDLIKKCRTRSGKANFEKKKVELEEILRNTELALERKEISKENKLYAAAKLLTAKDGVRKRRVKLESQEKAAVAKLYERVDSLVAQLSEAKPEEEKRSGIFDIKQHLTLSKEEWKIYDVTIDFFRDFFADDEETCARAIRIYQEKLMDVFGSR